MQSLLDKIASLQLYNSQSQSVESFVPISTKQISGKIPVNLYVCGVTPYSTDHLGHLFVFLYFDVLVDVLSALGTEVNYLQNVTDIDLPLFKKAIEQETSVENIVDFWTDYLLEDFKKLEIRKPRQYVKASEVLETMQKLVISMIENGYVYQSGGNYYFATDKYTQYGKMTGLTGEKLLQLSASEFGGNDIDDPHKHNPLDFPVWISHKNLKDMLGLTLNEFEKLKAQGRLHLFESKELGEGIPGWHLECTSLIYAKLGHTIDIHGGGYDLKFPHHESEIAQAQASHGDDLANFWVHVGMVSYQGHKMSKSRGNTVSLNEVLARVMELNNDLSSTNFVRYFLLSHNYRTGWEFKWENLTSSILKYQKIIAKLTKQINLSSLSSLPILTLRDLEHPATKIILDDLNIPKFFEWIAYSYDPTQETNDTVLKLWQILMKPTDT